MSEPLQIDAREITHLLGALLQTTDKNPASAPEARRIAAMLSDDFADDNDDAAKVIREIIRLTKEALPPKLRDKLQDILDVALARVDVKASLKYWLRDDDGDEINLTVLNCFEIDFFRYAHQDVLIPILAAPMGPQPLDAKLLTPRGWTTMGDIRVGNEVIGADGKATIVEGVYPQGLADVYRIHFSDRSSVECTRDHLWQVSSYNQRYSKRHPDKSRDGSGHFVKTLGELSDNLRDKAGNRRWFIPVVRPVEFETPVRLPIDPYLLGVLLGDGGLGGPSVNLTSVDAEVVAAVEFILPPDMTIRKRGAGPDKEWSICKRIRNSHRQSSLMVALGDLGLAGHRAWEKFIPEDYLLASVADRISLLQGILDADGSAAGSQRGDYSTTSKHLGEDFQFLVWSLGGVCVAAKPRNTSYTYKGVKKAGRTSYRFSFRLPPHINPFRLSRKASRIKSTCQTELSRSIDRVEYVGFKDVQCIRVEAADGLYVTDDFIITHNSGKTTLIRGLICFEIGQNQDTMQQLVCQSDSAAQQRCLKIMDTLMSPHYQKVYPQIKKDTRQWGNAGFLVQRTRAAVKDVTKSTRGNAGGVDPTLAPFGVTSRAMTGTRTLMTDLDDVVTVESGLLQPKEGETIDEALRTKVFTREKAPIGKTDEEYDRTKNPTRFRIIGTPYSQEDPIYKRRDWKGAMTAVIGVNDDFTAYNVQLWNVPEKYYRLLRRKYGTGTIKFPKMPDELREYCEAEGIPVVDEYTLGPGIKKDLYKPPDYTMEIPLAIAREWYIEKYRNAEDKRTFNLPYKCEVASESELLFPNFRNSVFKYYPDYDNTYNPKWTDPPVPMILEKSAIVTLQNNAKMQTGVMARLVNPPQDYKIKIAMVDLSKKGRRGTVITVAVLTPSNRRRIVEIRRGGWGGEDIATQIGEVFLYHPDLQVCYIESVTLQSLFVDLLKASKEKYEWWPKVGYFEETTSGKNDPQIGIMVMGIGYAGGAFELPDITLQPDHGWKCQCGYCVGIKDGTTQSRLAPVESDVLITFWGVHLKMPVSFKPATGLSPSVQQRAQSGYELGTHQGQNMGAKIIGIHSTANLGERKDQSPMASEPAGREAKEAAKAEIVKQDPESIWGDTVYR